MGYLCLMPSWTGILALRKASESTQALLNFEANRRQGEDTLLH